MTHLDGTHVTTVEGIAKRHTMGSIQSLNRIRVATEPAFFGGGGRGMHAGVVMNMHSVLRATIGRPGGRAKDIFGGTSADARVQDHPVSPCAPSPRPRPRSTRDIGGEATHLLPPRRPLVPVDGSSRGYPLRRGPSTPFLGDAVITLGTTVLT